MILFRCCIGQEALTHRKNTLRNKKINIGILETCKCPQNGGRAKPGMLGASLEGRLDDANESLEGAGLSHACPGFAVHPYGFAPPHWGKKGEMRTRGIHIFQTWPSLEELNECGITHNPEVTTTIALK